jgi:hypothetical protein
MLVASNFVLGLLPPPALGESQHRGLARRGIALASGPHVARRLLSTTTANLPAPHETS